MTSETRARLLHFSAGNRGYALPLEFVKEIIRMVAVTPVIELPTFVEGVIDLRGQIVPVIDFHKRAGGTETKADTKSRIIIVQINGILVGLLVDRVLEVMAIGEGDISRNVDKSVIINPKYISGMVSRNTQVIAVVDVVKILTDKEFKHMKKGIQNA